MLRLFFLFCFWATCNVFATQTGYIADLSGFSVKIFDTSTNTVTGILNDPGNVLFGNGPTAIAIHPAMKKGYIGTVNGNIYIFSTETNTIDGQVNNLPFNPTIFNIVFSPDGSKAYASGVAVALMYIDPLTDTFLGLVATGDNLPLSFIASSDNTYGFFQTLDGLYTFNPKQAIQSDVQRISTQITGGGLALDSSETNFYASNSLADSSVYKFNVQSSQLTGTFATTNAFEGISRILFFSDTPKLFLNMFKPQGLTYATQPAMFNTITKQYQTSINGEAFSGLFDLQTLLLQKPASSLQYVYFPYYGGDAGAGVAVVDPQTNTVIGKLISDELIFITPTQVAITPSGTQNLQNAFKRFLPNKFTRVIQ